MTKNILVLGANGKVGRRLVPILKDQHATEVRPASRTGESGFVMFDWHDASTWHAALSDVAGVFLVTPEMVEDPSTQVDAFLALARRFGVEKVVAVSSLGVTFPTEPQTSGRLKVEASVATSGMSWTILRPGGFHQNFSEGFFAPGVQAGVVQTATGSGKTAFIDAGDIAAVAATALISPDHDGQTYSLTGPETLSFQDAVGIIGEVAGRPVEYHTLSEDEFRTTMLGFGLPPAFAEVVVRDQLAIRDGFAAQMSSIVADVTGRTAIDFSSYARATFASRE